MIRKVVHRTACNRACSKWQMLCKWTQKSMLCKWPKEPVLRHIKTPNSLYKGVIELISIPSLLSPVPYPWKYTISSKLSQSYSLSRTRRIWNPSTSTFWNLVGYINTMWQMTPTIIVLFICIVLFCVHLPSILWRKSHHSFCRSQRDI